MQESRILVQRLLHLNRGLPGSTVYDFSAGRQTRFARRLFTIFLGLGIGVTPLNGQV